MADQAGADGQTVEQQLGAQIVRLNQNEQELRRMISTLQARVDAQDVGIQRGQRRGRHRGKGGISDSDDEEPEERRQVPQDIVDKDTGNGGRPYPTLRGRMGSKFQSPTINHGNACDAKIAASFVNFKQFGPRMPMEGPK